MTELGDRTPWVINSIPVSCQNLPNTTTFQNVSCPESECYLLNILVTSQVQPMMCLLSPCSSSQSSWRGVWLLPDQREDSISRKEVQKPRGNQDVATFYDSRAGQMSGAHLEVEASKSRLPISLSRAHALALEQVRVSSLCRTCQHMYTNFYRNPVIHDIWGSNTH